MGCEEGGSKADLGAQGWLFPDSWEGWEGLDQLSVIAEVGSEAERVENKNTINIYIIEWVVGACYKYSQCGRRFAQMIRPNPCNSLKALLSLV